MKKLTRKSNIELLRIISIIMIICHHYALYSGFNFDNNVTINKMFVDVVSSFGKLGAIIFIIISGYFYKKNNLTIKNILKIIIPVWFISLLGLICGVLNNSQELSIVNIVRSLFPNFFGLYWFTTCYIIIQLLSPLFKLIIEHINKNTMKYCMYMLLGYFFIVMIPKTLDYTNDLIIMSFCYMGGGLIYKYKANFEEKNKKYVMQVFLILIMIILFIIGINIVGLNHSFILKYTNYINTLHSPLIIILGFDLFLIFKNIKIKDNKIINFISSKTLGVYLLHDNIFIRDFIWRNFIQGNKYINSIYLPLNLIYGVISVYIICLFITFLLQMGVFNPLENFLCKIINKKLEQGKIFMFSLNELDQLNGKDV